MLTREFLLLFNRGIPITPFPFTQDFSANASLGGWIIPGAAAVAAGKVNITPTLEPDVIINGGFGANTDWNFTGGWGIAGGVASNTGPDGNLSAHVNPLVAGRWYRVVYTQARTAGGNAVYLNGFFVGYMGGSSTYTLDGLSDGGQFYLSSGGSFNGSVDNIFCYPIPLRTMLMARRFAITQGILSATIVSPNSSQRSGIIGWLNDPYNPINFIEAFSSRASASLVKVVNGIRTVLIGESAITYSSGALLEIRRLAGTNTFQLWYNGTQVSTDKTITDASVINNQYFGILSANAANGCGAFSFQ